MTKGEDLIKNANCSQGHRSAMSKAAWCDLKKKLYCFDFKRYVP